MKTITIKKPFDLHCHFRDGDKLARTVADCAERFHSAIAMPNLVPPITSVAAALAYQDRILKHVPKGRHFTPLMTLYLTESMSPQTLTDAKKAGIIAAKLYPAGATTNSDFGVSELSTIYPLFAAMQDAGLLLLIHGESTSSQDDIFDREAIFIEKTLSKLINDFPKLKIVLEHVSTKKAVEFVQNGPDTLAATITAHHLLLNRNDLLSGGIRPHHYCLPILKRNTDQEALNSAATSGSSKFFLGTDSAPHTRQTKETRCGCAGIYTAHAGIELYAEIFAKQNALDQLEKFASLNGPKFYGLNPSEETITLIDDPWQVPTEFTFGDSTLTPFRAGEKIQYRLQQ